jgi:inosine/xanthosine triphosphate pyrophosphatase family protein
MTKILIATGNDFKFGIGRANLQHFGIEAEQVVLEIDEIQGEDADLIIRAKAAAAYAAVGKPILVTDDSWNFSGLRGFPGPYMKSMNYWLTPDDFIRLTRNLDDWLVTLEQRIAYQDEHECVIFRKDLPGILLTEPRGEYGAPLMKVVSIDGDNGLSISEMHDAGKTHDEKRIARGSAWSKFGEWHQQSHQAN